jgi:hypothetical protein
MLELINMMDLLLMALYIYKIDPIENVFIESLLIYME